MNTDSALGRRFEFYTRSTRKGDGLAEHCPPTQKAYATLLEENPYPRPLLYSLTHKVRQCCFKSLTDTIVPKC